MVHYTNKSVSRRWFFSSTVFPLIAGTFGPLATAFNICTLTEDWRTFVNASSIEQEGQFIADPAW